MKQPSISPKFLDIVENSYASESNPHRIGIYIRSATRSGRLNPGKFMTLTDGKGDYWEVGYTNDRLSIIGNYAQKKYQEGELKGRRSELENVMWAWNDEDDLLKWASKRSVELKSQLEKEEQ